MKRKGKIFVTTLVSLLVCVIVLLVGMNIYAGQNKDTIAEGVYVDSIDLSGKTEAQAQKLVDDYIEELGNTTIVITVDGNKIKTKLSKLGFEVVTNDYIEQAANLGKTGNLIKRYKEIQDIKHQNRVFNLEFTIDEELTKTFLEKKGTKYEVEAVDATMTRKDGAFVIKDEVTGRELEIDDTVTKIQNAIKADWGGGKVTVEAVMKDAQPDCTAEMLSKVTDVLGEYNTSYSSSTESRSANIANAAKLIDGTILLPGEEFSTSTMLEPFTEDNGYSVAGAYSNGQVVDSVGGGVCQAATTLYNAVLNAELEVTERYNHSMIVSYVEPSMDAAISEGYKDLKFKNSYDTPIYIQAYTSGRTVYFVIYGEETRDTENRKVVYQSETLETIQPGEDIITEDDTKPSSYRVVEQSAHVGYTAKLWKIVYVNGEQESKEQVNYSSYAAEPAHVTVGTIEEEKEEDKDEEDTDSKTDEKTDDESDDEDTDDDSDSSSTKKDSTDTSDSSDSSSSSKKSSSSSTSDSSDSSSSSKKSSSSSSSSSSTKSSSSSSSSKSSSSSTEKSSSSKTE